MGLYVTGCSVTYGDDLTNGEIKNDAWPIIVGAELNMPVTNHGVSGGSNDMMVADVMLNAINHDHIIVGWSGIDRFTLEDSTNWINVRFNKQLKQDFYAKKDYFKYYGQYHYLYWNSLIFNFKKWLIQIISLQRYLKSLGKTYHMFSVVGNQFELFTTPKDQFIEKLGNEIDITKFSDEQILNKYNEVQILLKQIDLSTFLLPTQFNASDLNKTHKVGPTGHLLVAGHKQLAKEVISFIHKG